MESKKPFITDVKKLRQQARADIEKGAVTKAYQGDVQQAIDILQSVFSDRDCLCAEVHDECGRGGRTF